MIVNDWSVKNKSSKGNVIFYFEAARRYSAEFKNNERKQYFLL